MLPVCCLRLPSMIVKKLHGAGFVFADDLFTINNELQPEVEQILMLYPQLKETVIESVKPPSRQTATDILKIENSQVRIVTFSYMLDKILGGGVPLGHIFEVCGPPGSGKTQLCLQLCVSIQLHKCLGGLQGEAVYIDTDAGFSPQRISDIAQGCKEHCYRVALALDLPTDEILSQTFARYYYTPVNGYTQLLATVFSLHEFIKEHNQVKLIIIDSLVFPFLQLKDMLKRTILLCRIMLHLSKLAQDYKLAVVVTNHLTTRISRGDDQLIPALGECVGYLCNSRLMLGQFSENSTYGGLIYKSSCLDNDSAIFKITGHGIRDHDT